MSPTFYLGTHHPHWLARTEVPLFVSARRLRGYKTLPRAKGRWALDSGGFTELDLHGRWTVTPAQYRDEIRRFEAEVGGLDWAAPQDWMCEPEVLRKTGKTIEEHQRLTLENYLDLRAMDLPVIPVLQGWGVVDYWRHEEAYEKAGVDLTKVPRVGLGTTCRRTRTHIAYGLAHTLGDRGVKVHLFGPKTSLIEGVAHRIASWDTMAWSYNARRRPPTPGCVGHKNCANCMVFAMDWRNEHLGRVLRGVTTPT